MSEQKSAVPAPGYSDRIAKAILARAIELDHVRSGGFSLADLRSIAAETMISDEALEDAIEEFAHGDSASTANHKVGFTRWNEVLTLGAIGGSTGILTAFLERAIFPSQIVTIPLAVGVMLMLSGGLAVFSRRDDVRYQSLGFQIRNAGIWAGFVVGCAASLATVGGPFGNTIGILKEVSVAGFALSAAVGGIASVWGRPSASTSSSPGSGSPPVIRRRMAATLKRWIDHMVNRMRLVTSMAGGQAGDGSPRRCSAANSCGLQAN